MDVVAVVATCKDTLMGVTRWVMLFIGISDMDQVRLD